MNNENEKLNVHMTIDEICSLLGGELKGYNTLNAILWSLQEQNVITFNEDKLDELYSSPAY